MIRSDTEYVVRIACGLSQCEREMNTEGNADLWAEFVSELKLKTTRHLHVVWVKGYASPQRLTKGEMTLLEHSLPLLQHTMQLRRR